MKFRMAPWLRLRRLHATKAMTTFRLTGKSLNETPRMVFHRNGDTYFLAGIWSGDGSLGDAYEKDKETEKAKKVSGKSTKIK